MEDYLVKTRETAALKAIDDQTIRHEELAGAFTARDTRFKGENILLFDDLFRSGETLSAITDVLRGNGKLSMVFALTITKTRSRR